MKTLKHTRSNKQSTYKGNKGSKAKPVQMVSKKVVAAVVRQQRQDAEYLLRRWGVR